MRRFKNRISELFGRWMARRIRTKQLRKDYRAYERNMKLLDEGEMI